MATFVFQIHTSYDGIQNRERRPLRGHRLRELGHGARESARRERSPRGLVCPQPRGARIAAHRRAQPPLPRRRGVRPRMHRPLRRSRRRGLRCRHRDSGHSVGLSQGPRCPTSSSSRRSKASSRANTRPSRSMSANATGSPTNSSASSRGPRTPRRSRSNASRTSRWDAATWRTPGCWAPSSRRNTSP